MGLAQMGLWTLWRFILEDDGATMAEYALLIALIGFVAIGALRFLGSTAVSRLDDASDTVR